MDQKTCWHVRSSDERTCGAPATHLGSYSKWPLCPKHAAAWDRKCLSRELGKRVCVPIGAS